MATIVEARFGGADLAAAASATLMPVLGEPDIADIAGVTFPFAVEIIGIIGASNNASGDTITLTPAVGGVAPTGAPTLLLSHAAAIDTVPTNLNCIMFGTGQGVKVAANAVIGCLYQTTTGGTYGAKDVLAILLIKLPDLV